MFRFVKAPPLQWLWVTLGSFAVLWGGFAWMGGSLWEAPTIALAVAGTILLRLLIQLYNMALTFVKVKEFESPMRAVRDGNDFSERLKQTLRAIKELEFDHQLGKISDEDFSQLHAKYEQRAFELLNKEQEAQEVQGLHPKLQQLLTQKTGRRTGAEPSDCLCSICGGANDSDARFCKHCGKELVV